MDLKNECDPHTHEVHSRRNWRTAVWSYSCSYSVIVDTLVPVRLHVRNITVTVPVPIPTQRCKIRLPSIEQEVACGALLSDTPSPRPPRPRQLNRYASTRQPTFWHHAWSFLSCCPFHVLHLHLQSLSVAALLILMRICPIHYASFLWCSVESASLNLHHYPQGQCGSRVLHRFC